MKQILMALAITTLTYCGAGAQTKKATEKCAVSKDGKTITCCKTTDNPAYKMNGKTAVVAKKPVVKKTIKTTETSRYQVCKEHGGAYTCCEYKHTKPVVTTTTVAQAGK